MKIIKTIIKGAFRVILFAALTAGFSAAIYAHCDSLDGPVVQDAYRALDKKDASLVMKWVAAEHEYEIEQLFNTTIRMKHKDSEVYALVERHFLETLVRYHRETEGAPYTGLKPAGSTEPIVQMADQSIADKEITSLLNDLNAHIRAVVTKKYARVMELEKVKDNSIAEGRAYVAAYVDYTHTLEALDMVLSHKGPHHQ